MDEQEKRDEHKLRNERVVRWDQYRVNHFSYTNNLFIALNLGFLGFFITQSGFNYSCLCWLLTLQILTVLLLGISFLTGILAVLNRLKDFRLTARLTKLRKKRFEYDHNIKAYPDIGEIRSDIRGLKTKTSALSPRTWILLNWQIWSFLIGTILGILYLIIEKNVCG